MDKFFLVFWTDLKHHIRRPLFLMLTFILVLNAWGMSTGGAQIQSGNSVVGGEKAWLTSEFSNAQLFAIITMLFYGFFVAVAAGMAVIQDEELKVGEILHATGLRTRQYIWAKFLSVLAGFAVVIAVQLAATIFCNHILPHDNTDKIRGPFALVNYVRPALVFAAPLIIFLAGVAFAIGERTRRAILVYFLPVTLFMLCIFFLWDWTRPNLDYRIEKALQLLDPTGFRWINETQLKIDKGVAYYNRESVPLPWDFALSRLAFIALGLLGVAWSHVHFARTLRAAHDAKESTGGARSAPPEPSNPDPAPIRSLGMVQANPGFLQQALAVARFEFSGLITSPGMYLFAPLIMFQVIARVYFAIGTMGTLLLVTPGSAAAATLNTLTLCTCLLLLFYTAESLHRERSCGLSQIFNTTPVRTGAILFGKALANTYVAAVIMFATWLACAIIMLLQGRVSMSLQPFFVVWGILLLPTMLFWSSFVMAVLAICNNKMTTYAVCLGALILTGVAQFRGWMNWVFNWDLWSTVRWTDMGLLEPNLPQLLLNRGLYLSLTALLIAVTVLVFARREFDATRIVHRLMPAALWHVAWRRVLPFAVAPIVLAIILGLQVSQGFQGRKQKNADKDYWKQNLATWIGKERPALAGADVDLELDPPRHHFKVRGKLVIQNIDTPPLQQFPLSVMTSIKETTWTLEGAPYKPDNRSNLFVFTPPKPLLTGEKVTVGYEYEGKFPDGATRNGGGMMEFIQPSGVVMGGWSGNFVPAVGFDEGTGVEARENQYEPERYAPDYYKTLVPSAFGSRVPFPTRVSVTGPKEYTYNSVGTLVSDEIKGDKRTEVWVSDHPVMMFNVIAGKWDVKRGEGTAIFYSPKHAYNVDDMLTALNGARKYYGEWFYPYPWKELKLSEFANLASYAQGFATNITFSESIGFLTRNSEVGRAAFTIAAHESAHQWWGNTLVPGKGPGGNILSEGMAHFSTMLLLEQIYGPQARIEFAKRIEESYGDSRQVDSEKALNQILGDKPGDTTVTYDKGGWVFWMLSNQVGRENDFKGLQAFIRNHLANPDHPLIEDFVEEMRPFAPDAVAYDAFTKQWFFEVVCPEYKLEKVSIEQDGGAWVSKGTIRNKGTGRMKVEVGAATTEDRFVKQTEKEAAAGPAAVAKDYRDARVAVDLAAGEAKPFEIRSDFEPKVVLVDPDALVLQLRRKDAIYRVPLMAGVKKAPKQTASAR